MPLQQTCASRPWHFQHVCSSDATRRLCDLKAHAHSCNRYRLIDWVRRDIKTTTFDEYTHMRCTVRDQAAQRIGQFLCPPPKLAHEARVVRFVGLDTRVASYLCKLVGSLVQRFPSCELRAQGCVWLWSRLVHRFVSRGSGSNGSTMSHSHHRHHKSHRSKGHKSSSRIVASKIAEVRDATVCGFCQCPHQCCIK